MRREREEHRSKRAHGERVKKTLNARVTQRETNVEIWARVSMTWKELRVGNLRKGPSWEVK